MRITHFTGRQPVLIRERAVCLLFTFSTYAAYPQDYLPAACIAALIFSTRSVPSMPCTIAASSSVSIWDAGQPRQCIPISIRIGAASGKIVINSPSDASPYILNFSCMCMTSEILLNAFNEHQIYVSARSTCSSKTRKPSRVLTSMGIDERRANRAIRVSLSHLNSEDEIKTFIKVLKEIMNEYRIKS